MNGSVPRPRALVLALSLALAACLEDPETPTCADFAFGTEGCGSPCDVYCETMLDFCPGSFDSFEQCNVRCALEPVGGEMLPPGIQGDTDGDTLACRITQALQGACVQAGLGPSPACSAVSCAEYCDVVLSAGCDGIYPSEQNCLDSCALFPLGEPGSGGNTVACRLENARMAAVEPTDALCNAASIGGGGVCGDVCEVYCDFLDLHCTGANALYPDRETCLATCTLMDTGGRFDDWDFSIEADSVQCRLYHAGPPAAVQPQVHCPHAAVYNVDHCGIEVRPPPQPRDWPCSTYCFAVLEGCPGVYADFQACFADCVTLPEIVDLPPGQTPDLFPESTLVCPSR